jgi:hypothetical protein
MVQYVKVHPALENAFHPLPHSNDNAPHFHDRTRRADYTLLGHPTRSLRGDLTEAGIEVAFLEALQFTQARLCPFYQPIMTDGV